jgi:hypothetical protein
MNGKKPILIENSTLKINNLLCSPAVKIFAFLELERT